MISALFCETLIVQSCCLLLDKSSVLTFWQVGVTLLGPLEVEEVSGIADKSEEIV